MACLWTGQCDCREAHHMVHNFRILVDAVELTSLRFASSVECMDWTAVQRPEYNLIAEVP